MLNYCKNEDRNKCNKMCSKCTLTYNLDSYNWFNSQDITKNYFGCSKSRLELELVEYIENFRVAKW